jgi:hypothetical protein
MQKDSKIPFSTNKLGVVEHISDPIYTEGIERRILVREWSKASPNKNKTKKLKTLTKAQKAWACDLSGRGPG